MTITVTGEEATRGILASVEEMGWDHVGSDHYERDGKPACLVGHALAHCHIPVEELEWMDDCPNSSIAVVDLPAATLTPSARAVLLTAQMLQDDGVHWGVAAEDALRTASRNGVDPEVVESELELLADLRKRWEASHAR